MKTNINTQQVQLFSIVNNSYIYVEYVKAVIKNVTSKICKTTKTFINNIKNSLNSKTKHSCSIKVGKTIKKVHKELRESELSGERDFKLRATLRELNKLRIVIRNIATT